MAKERRKQKQCRIPTLTRSQPSLRTLCPILETFIDYHELTLVVQLEAPTWYLVSIHWLGGYRKGRTCEDWRSRPDLRWQSLQIAVQQFYYYKVSLWKGNRMVWCVVNLPIIFHEETWRAEVLQCPVEIQQWKNSWLLICNSGERWKDQTHSNLLLASHEKKWFLFELSYGFTQRRNHEGSLQKGCTMA